jgi:hypothetical protein
MGEIHCNQVLPVVMGYCLALSPPHAQVEFFDAGEFFDPAAAEKATDGNERVFSSATVWGSRPLTMTPKVAVSPV